MRPGHAPRCPTPRPGCAGPRRGRGAVVKLSPGGFLVARWDACLPRRRLRCGVGSSAGCRWSCRPQRSSCSIGGSASCAAHRHRSLAGLKLAFECATEREVLDAAIESAVDLPFDLSPVPLKYPPPTQLSLWIVPAGELTDVGAQDVPGLAQHVDTGDRGGARRRMFVATASAVGCGAPRRARVAIRRGHHAVQEGSRSGSTETPNNGVAEFVVMQTVGRWMLPGSGTCCSVNSCRTLPGGRAASVARGWRRTGPAGDL